MSITAEDGARRRVIAVDVLRGLVVVLMTLDHVRDYCKSLAAEETSVGVGQW